MRVRSQRSDSAAQQPHPWGKEDCHSRCMRQYKRNPAPQASRGAKHRFTDEQKEQAVKMRAEGMSLSAIVRVVGARLPTVSEWVKNVALASVRLTRFLSWRTSGRPSSVRASIVAFDNMWTYLGVRRGERRKDLWILTVVAETGRATPRAWEMLKHPPGDSA